MAFKKYARKKCHRAKRKRIHKHLFQELLHWMLKWIGFMETKRDESILFSCILISKIYHNTSILQCQIIKSNCHTETENIICSSIHKIKSKILMELDDSNWIQLDANVYKMHHTKMICIPYTDQNHCKKLLINKIPSEWK